MLIPEKHRIECSKCHFESVHIFTDEQIQASIPKSDGSHINWAPNCPNCGELMEIRDLKSNKL